MKTKAQRIREEKIALIKNLFPKMEFKGNVLKGKDPSNPDKLVRFKFMPNVCRYEAQIVIPASEYAKEYKQWIRLRSAKYSDIEISSSGKTLKGFKK